MVKTCLAAFLWRTIYMFKKTLRSGTSDTYGIYTSIYSSNQTSQVSSSGSSLPVSFGLDSFVLVGFTFVEKVVGTPDPEGDMGGWKSDAVG